MRQEIMEISTTTELDPMRSHQPPAKHFAIAVRLPPNWGQASIGLAILISVFLFVVLVLIPPSDQSALIEAQQAHIASLEKANDQLAQANENIAHIASKTITGLSSKDFIAFGAIVLLAVAMCLLLSFVIPLQACGAFVGMVGIILLVSGG